MSHSPLIIQRQLLSYLSDGQLYSGQWLAEKLGLSRTAIANHIGQLQQLGIDIYKIKGKGYRLPAVLQLLDAATIKQLQPEGAAPILVQHITDSTNNQLLQRCHDSQLLPGFSLVAEAQTAGRGRRGKSWYSPYGANLYFSMYWHLTQGIQAAMGLSLVVGIALCKLLKTDYQLDAKVKWPNDLYINNRKLAGILVELAGPTDGGCDVVIGIGMNIQMPNHAATQIDQPWTDLMTECAQPVERNRLIARLQQQLQQLLEMFSAEGFSRFIDEFNQLNQHANKRVQLSGAQNAEGVFIGVDRQGGVVLETREGRRSFYGGEVSLRAENVSAD